jgi:hypothetical protein
MRAALRLLAGIAIGALLASCHFGRASRDQLCNVGPRYERAQSVPPLRTADGLSAANSKNALKIPDVPTTLKLRTKREGCLDEPPSFFPGRPKPGSKQAVQATPPAARAAPAPEAPAPAVAPPAEPAPPAKVPLPEATPK